MHVILLSVFGLSQNLGMEPPISIDSCNECHTSKFWTCSSREMCSLSLSLSHSDTHLFLQLAKPYAGRDARDDDAGDSNSMSTMNTTDLSTYTTNTSTVYVVLLAATYIGDSPGDTVYTVSSKPVNYLHYSCRFYCILKFCSHQFFVVDLICVDELFLCNRYRRRSQNFFSFT